MTDDPTPPMTSAEQGVLAYAEHVLELADAARDGARLRGPGTPEQIAELDRASDQLSESAALVRELRALFSRRVLDADGEPTGCRLSVSAPGTVRLEGPSGAFEVGFECRSGGASPGERPSARFFDEGGEARLVVTPYGRSFGSEAP